METTDTIDTGNTADKETPKQSPLSLASLFSTCVECFGLIHTSEKWERSQHLELTKLGLQQGRLLVWGDVVGICESGDRRDSRIDEAATRGTIDAALKAIIDRPQHTDRVAQFEKFGLKPPKRSPQMFEPALDFNRLEAFREKLHAMRERERERAGETRRAKSATYTHWQIVDKNKFAGFVALIKENVDLLIKLFDVSARVDVAMRHDIKAFGWHPVFERGRAARDTTKLKMIRDVCETEYPTYAEAAVIALEQLDRERNDNYQAIMERTLASTQVAFAASKQQQHGSIQKPDKRNGERRGSLFDLFRPKHKRKRSKQLDTSKGPPDSPGTPETVESRRSKSLGYDKMDAENGDALMDARSKSISVIPMKGLGEEPKTSVTADMENKAIVDPNSRMNTAKDLPATGLEPMSSMVSRHDQAAQHRASVA